MCETSQPRPPLSRSHHGRQVTAPAHILAPVTPGTAEHSPPYVGVVGQAAVLKDACNHMATADSLFCVSVGLHVHCVCRHPRTHHKHTTAVPGPVEAEGQPR